MKALIEAADKKKVLDAWKNIVYLPLPFHEDDFIMHISFIMTVAVANGLDKKVAIEIEGEYAQRYAKNLGIRRKHDARKI